MRERVLRVYPEPETAWQLNDGGLTLDRELAVDDLYARRRPRQREMREVSAALLALDDEPIAGPETPTRLAHVSRMVEE